MIYKALPERMGKKMEERRGMEERQKKGRKERKKKKINDSGMNRWCCESREVHNLDRGEVNFPGGWSP